MTKTPWILVDPIHKHPDTGKPIFMGPDGTSTTDPTGAVPFPTEDEAKKAGEGKPDRWVPAPLGDYLPSETTDDVDVDAELMEAELSARRDRIDALTSKGATFDSGSRTYSFQGRSYDEDGNPL